MTKIPIISSQKKPHVPKNKELSVLQDRFQITGKPSLTLTSSFSPQAKKQKENGANK